MLQLLGVAVTSWPLSSMLACLTSCPTLLATGPAAGSERATYSAGPGSNLTQLLAVCATACSS
jgi:hypothetical protein